MKERTTLSIKLIASHLVLLPVLIFISLFVNSGSFLLLSVIQTLLLVIILAGYWEFFGLKFRIIYYCIIQTFIVAVNFYKITLNSTSQYNIFLVTVLAIIQAYLLFELVKIFIVIYHRDKKSIEIEFPLKDGRFLITDGGNSKISRLMNYHYHSRHHKRKGTNSSMKFATDIVRIEIPLGSYFPTENSKYPIFNKNVYSPLSGFVIKVVNDIEDNIPYSGNYPYNTGNTIVIRDGDLFMLIGHLKMGSIIKKEGEKVDKGEMIARAGNSGFTERPHIHMQLARSDTNDYWSGMGVGITYRHKNLYKNRIISVGHIS